MCGIIGYVGQRDLAAVLIAGLERLSYRGYDSSGIAVISRHELSLWKSAGKVQRLIERYMRQVKIPQGTAGIAHTRWATHGAPTDANAHPHHSNDKKIAVVHNGIIENFAALKENLSADFLFQSETDTEVVAHLLEKELTPTSAFLPSLQNTLRTLQGTYALAILTEAHPQTIFVARQGSPLIIGIGDNEQFIASDLVALLPHTRTFIYLEDGEYATVTPQRVDVYNAAGQLVEKPTKKLKLAADAPPNLDKGRYPHYMLKEIYEQPQVLKRICRAYVRRAGSPRNPSLAHDTIEFKTLHKYHPQLTACKRFFIQACGTSWHAGLIAKYWIEEFAHIPTEVDISSEFRYRKILIGEDDIVLALSQSGETADTLAGIHEVKRLYKNLPVLSFINRYETTMERASDAIIPSLAGIEIGVASTKNYIAQLGTLFLFALHIGQLRGLIKPNDLSKYLAAFQQLPALSEKLLHHRQAFRQALQPYAQDKGFFFIGRGVNYPSALEGALKLKEISYLYAAGYAAGELKHGPIALIDENMPVVVIIPQTNNYAKMMNNLEEVRSRKGKIIAIATAGDDVIAKLADTVFYIPPTLDVLSPLLAIIPLQLLAYDMAVALRRDVDQPKNLAKSVTVE